MAAAKTIRLYENSRSHGRCRSCGIAVDWFETLNGKNMPMQAGAVSLRTEFERETAKTIGFFEAADSHWNHCSAREQFK